LNLLHDARLTIEDFEHEAFSIDRMTAHALEEFLGHWSPMPGWQSSERRRGR